MTTPIDPFERRLPEVFTDLAAARTPDYLIDILGQTARTRQRPAWATPGRWTQMLSVTNRPAIAAVTAIALIVLVGGGIVLNRGGQSGVGGPPAPTPTPTAAPTASPSPSATPPLVTLGELDARRYLAPGKGLYRVGPPFGLPFRFAISSLDWTVDKVSTGEYAMVGGPHWLVVDLIENVYADPCRSGGGPLALPPSATVDGIVAALDGMKDFTVGPTTDIVIDGHEGKEFDLYNALDPATADCDGGGMIPIWTYRGGGSTSADVGSGKHIAIIDVGGTPVAIGWSTGPGCRRGPCEPVDETVRTLDFE